MKKVDTDLQGKGNCPALCHGADAPAMEAQGCEVNAPNMAVTLDVAEAALRSGAQGKPLADVLAAQRRKL